MVEIPEHLLKRSKERRAALGLGGGEDTPASDDSPAKPAQASAAPAPAPAKAAPPPKPKPEPPKPDPIYVQAAKTRQRLPYWVVPVFAALPIWGFFFVNTLSPAEGEIDPMAEGASIYTSAGCAGCHQANGSGSGSFPALTDVQETFPDYRDHMMWVRVGAQDWPAGEYGETNVANTHTMPGFHDSLTDEQIAQVVLYERQEFADDEITDEEIEGATTPDGEPLTEEHLLQIATGELTFAEVGVGPESADAGFTEADLEE